MKTKKSLDILMNKEEYSAFVDYLNKGKHIEFMKSYVAKYKEHNLLYDNVWSLALNKVLLFNDIKTLEKMLSIKLNSNILTTADSFGYSPIAKALSVCEPDVDTTAWKILENHLKNPKNKLSKVKLEGRELLSIRSAVRLPKFDYGSVEYNLEYYTKHLLTHVFTPESIEYLKNIVEYDSKFNPTAYIKQFERQQSDQNLSVLKRI